MTLKFYLITPKARGIRQELLWKNSIKNIKSRLYFSNLSQEKKLHDASRGECFFFFRKREKFTFYCTNGALRQQSFHLGRNIIKLKSRTRATQQYYLAGMRREKQDHNTGWLALNLSIRPCCCKSDSSSQEISLSSPKRV